jgi:hypothetical protein
VIDSQFREWEYDEPRKEPRQRKPKGHKHDKLKVQKCVTVLHNAPCTFHTGAAELICCRRLAFPLCRQLDIAEKMEGMDAAMEKHRVNRRNITVPLIDRLLLTPKQMRLKARGT